MVTAQEKAVLKRNLEKYEGRVHHFYKDSKGYITIGVGHLVKDLAAAQRLSMKKPNGQPASKDEIKADYEAIGKQPGKLVASSYKKFVALHLTDSAIDALTEKHIESFEKELIQIFPDFPKYPAEVRLGLFDMIFNLGMTRLSNIFVKFKKAVKEQNWAVAAQESKREEANMEGRNKYVRELFEKAAADEAERKKKDQEAKQQEGAVK